MPVKECRKDGKDGYKWGDKGTCYTGPDAYEKALEQGRAIEFSKTQSVAKQRITKRFGK